jgi:hypothetical protein
VEDNIPGKTFIAVITKKTPSTLAKTMVNHIFHFSALERGMATAPGDFLFPICLRLAKVDENM